jgi:S-DNA-T family DNA segregation ATPase FtsK/SpoIIIE
MNYSLIRISGFLLLVALATYLAMSLFSFSVADPGWFSLSAGGEIRNQGGLIGSWLADLILRFLGYSGYLLVVGIGYLGWRVLHDGSAAFHGSDLLYRLPGILITLTASSGLISLMSETVTASERNGGMLGNFASHMMLRNFTPDFSGLFMATLLLAGISLATGLSWLSIVDRFGAFLLSGWKKMFTSSVRLDKKALSYEKPAITEEPASVAETGRAPVRREREREPIGGVGETRSGRPIKTRVQAIPNIFNQFLPVIDPRRGLRHMTSRSRDRKDSAEQESDRPPHEQIQALLTTSSSEVEFADAPSPQLRQALRTWLQDFGIEVNITHVTRGPVITRFALEPAPGIKGNQIKLLGNDLLRGLTAAIQSTNDDSLSASHIRVVEVTPEQSTVMLEVPNKQRPEIRLGDIIASESYRNSDSPLPLALGKDFNGDAVVIELNQISHLLVAGSAGSGISMALKTMLISMLCGIDHKRIELLLIDPARLEFFAFSDISRPAIHLITDVDEAIAALRENVREMQERTRLLADLNVADINQYNARIRDSQQPLYDPKQQSTESAEATPLSGWSRKVVMVADLADLAGSNAAAFEDQIELLTRRGRTVGIHMILATQRPSAEVISHRMKSNIPCRIAFQVASAVGSDAILDQSGAETLLGRGDMLLLRPGKPFAERIHGALISSDEVERIVSFLRQSG